MYEHFSLSYKCCPSLPIRPRCGYYWRRQTTKQRPLYRSRRCKPGSCASATMLLQLVRRSTTIRRSSFGYRPTRLFATRSSFPCKVCLSECLSLRGQSKSGKHALLGPFDAAPGSTPPRFDCVCMASHASTNQRRFIAACWEPKLAPCAVSGDRERR